MYKWSGTGVDVYMKWGKELKRKLNMIQGNGIVKMVHGKCKSGKACIFEIMEAITGAHSQSTPHLPAAASFVSVIGSLWLKRQRRCLP